MKWLFGPRFWLINDFNNLQRLNFTSRSLFCCSQTPTWFSWFDTHACDGPPPRPDPTYRTLDLLMWLWRGMETDTLLCGVVFLIITPHRSTSAAGWQLASHLWLHQRTQVHGLLQNEKTSSSQAELTSNHQTSAVTGWIRQQSTRALKRHEFYIFPLKSSPLLTLSAVMRSWLLLSHSYHQNAIKAEVITCLIKRSRLGPPLLSKPRWITQMQHTSCWAGIPH